MTGEQTPLINSNDEYYIETEYGSILPQFVRKSKPIKYMLLVLVTGFVLLLVYVMVVVLPSVVPDAVSIPDFSMVKSTGIYLRPLVAEKKDKPEDPDDPVKIIPDFKHLDFLDESNPILREHLDKLRKWDPNFDNKIAKKRMILIGDVHGSLHELKRFLSHVNYDGGKEDYVLLLGDFVNKGPDSIGVINYIMENNIDCVLGNHDLAMLKRYIQLHNVQAPVFKNKNGYEDSHLSLREHFKFDDLMKIAKKLTPEHMRFLSSLSAIKTLGPVPRFNNKKQSRHAEFPAQGYAVHAGLMWDRDIDNQEIEDVTTMRDLLPPFWNVSTEDTKTKIGGVKSVPWTKVWNEVQHECYSEELEKVNDSTLTIGSKVFYGHAAGRGVTLKDFSTGLDSGCVYGKQLTGTIIWAQMSSHREPKIVYKQMVVDINC